MSEKSSVPSEPTAPSEEFIQLFSRSQRQIFLYILSLVGNPDDAEEILQETNVVIWQKYHRFQMGTNFIAWTFQIAKFEVKRFREKRRHSKLMFCDELLDMLDADTQNMQDEFDGRRVALQECLKKLRPKDRELVEMRYEPGNRGIGVAETIGRPSNSVYQSLSRIRKTLLECVNRRLAADGV